MVHDEQESDGRLAPSGADEAGAGMLGDFRIVREIGRGGMGVVYEAEQVSLRRRVALKMLPFAAVLDARQLQRFRNEAVAAASLKHPGIVQVYSVGCERGIHYYAMEYVEGQTLAEVIRQLREEYAAGVRRQKSAVKPRPLVAAPATPARDGEPRADSLLPPSAVAPSAMAAPKGTDPTVTLIASSQDVAPEHSLPLTVSPSSVATSRGSRAQVSGETTPFSSSLFRTVASWGIQAAEALEHAHQMGVVHRDIKPSNLLVQSPLASAFSPSTAPSQGAPEAKDSPSAPSGKGAPREVARLLITDFGLAQTQTTANLTLTGDIMGTLRYMSPEQAQGNRQVLDHRSDIYSLGVTLYELLTLRSPFQSDDRHVLMHQIVDGDPPTLRQVNRAIPRDLETIVLKAIAVEPQHRYATAQELADELKRYLEHKPIRARRPSALELAAKWARRHQNTVLSTLAAMILALVSLAVSTVLVTGAYRRERDQRVVADQQRVRAEDREIHLRHNLYASDLRLAHEAWKITDLRQALELLNRHLPRPDETDVRGFEWAYLRTLCEEDRPTLRGHTGEVYCLAYSPDGKTLASASQDGTVRLWDPAARKLVRTLTVHAREANHVAFSPDGATLVATGDNAMVKLWETATGKEKGVLKGHSDDVFGAAFSPDGKLLATGACDDTVRLWSTQTWREEAVLRGHTGDVQALAFAPDGKTLASVSSDETIKLWDVAARKEKATLPGRATLSWVAFSPDGRKIAAAGLDRMVRVWQTADLSESRSLQGHSNWVHCATFSPDGSLLASASRDGSVRIWGVTTGETLNVLRGHSGRVWSAAFSPDGKTLATAGGDRTIKLWDPTARQDCQRGPRSPAGVHTLSFTPDGMLLLWTNEVALWDPRSAPEARKARWVPEATGSVAFSPDGRVAAIGNMGGGVKLWNAVTGELLIELGRHGAGAGVFPVNFVVFSADGLTLASYCETDGTLKVWDVASRRQRTAVRVERPVDCLAVANDGRTVIVSRANSVKVLDVATGQWAATLRGGSNETTLCLAFSPDGATLATAGDDRVVRLWDTATWRPQRVLVGHGDWVVSLAYTPDGKTLASGSREGTVRFWSPVSGQELLDVQTPLEITHLAFSQDGKILAGGGSPVGREGGVYLWNAEDIGRVSRPRATSPSNAVSQEAFQQSRVDR